MNTIDQLHDHALVGMIPVHPLQQPLVNAAMKLLNLRPTRIVGEPNLADAESFLADVEAVINIVDPLVAELGKYAGQNWPGIDQSLFKDQLRQALEGNATFEIERAARNYE